MALRFVGKNAHRLSGNPREWEFSKAWEAENAFYDGKSLLAYMLSEEG